MVTAVSKGGCGCEGEVCEEGVRGKGIESNGWREECIVVMVMLYGVFGV